MIVDLPEELELALKEKALVRGVSASVFVRELLDRELASPRDETASKRPFKTGRGILAKYGSAPSSEEIDENRREMFSLQENNIAMKPLRDVEGILAGVAMPTYEEMEENRRDMFRGFGENF